LFKNWQQAAIGTTLKVAGVLSVVLSLTVGSFKVKVQGHFRVMGYAISVMVGVLFYCCYQSTT